MFDFAFAEMLIIALVALIVIGPERLPRMARTAGHMLGRLQRYVSDVKADINREIELDELRKMRDSLQKAATDFESTVQTEMHKTETDLNRTVDDVVKDTAADPALNPAPDSSAPDSALPVEAPADTPAEPKAG